jgi:anti-anti-sigma factor
VELLRVEEGESPASFRLIGELDLSNVPQLQARLVEKLRQARKLTLETSDLTFMDSQGLRMLIGLGTEATELGTTVIVLNPSTQVRQLLDLTVPTGIPGVEILGADK